MADPVTTPCDPRLVEAIHPADSVYQQSLAARDRGDAKGARRLIASGLALDADRPACWYGLAVALYAEGKPHAAVSAMARVLSIVPGDPHALTNLGIYLNHAGRYYEAEMALLQATQGAPDLPLGWCNLCLVQSALGKFDEAIAAGRKAVSCEPDNGNNRLALAFAYLYKGDFATGLRVFEGRFKDKLPEFNAIPMPRWGGRKVEHLLVLAEQGLGDTLMFLRYLHLVMDCATRVSLGIHAELVPLIHKKFPKVNCIPMPLAVPKADAFIPLISIPSALGMSSAEVLAVPHDYLQSAWHAIRGSRISCERLKLPNIYTAPTKVGIVWAGNPEQDNDKNRSTKIEDFLLLAEIRGVQLYALQAGKRAYDTAAYPGLVIDIGSKLQDFSDTSAVLGQLDYVVTVCTSVAHLAGALGKPQTLVLPPYAGSHWTWARGGGVSPFYPNITTFAQPKPHDWETPMRQAAHFIINDLNTRAAQHAGA